MSKSKIQSIVILLFFIIFSYFYIGEYFSYHKNNNNISDKEKIVGNSSDNFSLKEIQKIDDIQILSTPNNGTLERIIGKIDNAKKRLYIEIYMFTNKKILSSVIKAKNRGIDIKIIMEKNPYRAPRINDKTYNKLIKNNINVVWSNPSNYSLNHTKLILVDNEIILSTGNLTYSTFKYNKDLFLFIKDETLLKKLEKIFLYDFKGIKSSEYLDNLVLSPNYSRVKLEKLISSSKNKIKLYFPYLKDDILEKLIIKTANKGVYIEILVSKDFYKKEQKQINKLINNGIKVTYLKKYKLHTKAILVDDKYLFIGSVNFSLYSLDKNREIGIILKNKKIVNDFKKIFNY